MTMMTTQDWLDSGTSRAELRTALSNGTVIRLRRGVVVNAESREASDLHRLKLVAAADQLGPHTYFAHESAAVLHGLPLLNRRLEEVVAVRTGGGHGVITPTLHARRAQLDSGDICEVHALPVTSLPRTVSDLVKRLPFPEAVMVADAGLHLGLEREELLERTAIGRGCRMAERALRFADPLAESPGESLSRVRFHQAHLPVPQLQHKVFDAAGSLIGRLDFWWEQQHLAGEFDGLVKYGKLLRPGETTEHAVLAEKRREQRLFDLGIRVIRWTWADLWSPKLVHRVDAALRGSKTVR